MRRSFFFLLCSSARESFDSAVLPALVVVVYVASQEADARLPTARALSAALGADATVILKDTPTPAEDELGRTDAAKTQAVAVVTWHGDSRRVQVRLLRVAAKRWLDREIQFAPADLPEERGRTTGFAIASMLPEEDVDVSRHTPPPPTPPTPSPPPSPPPDVPREDPTRKPSRYQLDLGALGALGVGGPATTLGVGLAGAWVPRGEGLGATMVGSLRFGEVSAAQSSALAASVGAGPTYVRWLGARRRASLGGRAAALLVYDRLSHFSGDEPEPFTSARVLPGARADVVVAGRFAENAGLFASLGAEVAFGKTDVYVRSARVTTLPPVRLLGSAGLRLTF